MTCPGRACGGIAALRLTVSGIGVSDWEPWPCCPSQHSMALGESVMHKQCGFAAKCSKMQRWQLCSTELSLGRCRDIFHMMLVSSFWAKRQHRLRKPVLKVAEGFYCLKYELVSCLKKKKRQAWSVCIVFWWFVSALVTEAFCWMELLTVTYQKSINMMCEFHNSHPLFMSTLTI